MMRECLKNRGVLKLKMKKGTAGLRWPLTGKREKAVFDEKEK